MRNKFNRIASVVILFSMAVSAMPLGAQAALVPGGAVGPVVPAGIGKGFPAWYMDQNGLAVELIEAADGFGISDPVDSANNFSQELGFNAEGFYWSADALPANPNGLAILVLALEAAFGGESAVDGEQSVFGRIRVKIDVPQTGTYTVRHPFGINVYNVDTVLPGGPEINDTSDIGCFGVPDPITGQSTCNNPTVGFNLALNSLIGPFLTWDTFDLNPALSDPLLVNPARPGKRYVGNPAQEHAIKGSPVGQNFFRIDGPNIGGPGVNFIQTNLFTVTGRIAVIDTTPPVIASVTPAELIVNAVGQVPANAVLNANITDDLGVRSATIDLGAIGNNFVASFNGAQAVPPTASQATGNGTFTIDTTANTLTFNVSAAGLTGGPIQGIHIHGPAAAGASAPMLFNLGNALPASGVWNYLEVNEADILAGNTYVNIHTQLFSDIGDGAEIRGQILPATDVRNMILVTPSNTSGTWRVLLPAITKIGTFILPITAIDGANVTNFYFSLAVTNPAPLANPDTATIGTNIGESATISVLANDTDPNGNLPLSLVSLQNVSIGTGVVSGNNVIITSPTNVFAGIITAQYTVADSLGATSVGDITVNVIRDVTAPVITVLGTNPIAVRLGGVYTDAGATALDDFDGDVTANIQTTNPVNTAVAGAYTVTYTVSDAVGNISTAIRTVNVEAPVLASIVVTPDPLLVPLGGSRQLTAQASDQFDIALSTQPIFAWTSNNQAVALVSASGTVDGVTLGSAVITATATVGAVTLGGTSAITVTSGPVCETTADANLSGTISNLEILNHVRSWKAGTVPNLEILNAIRFWKAGTGC